MSDVIRRKVQWSILVTICVLVTLLVGVGLSYASAERKPSEVDHLIEVYLAEKIKIEQGQKAFERLLQSGGDRIPAYGSEEYTERLLGYANPEGELRREDPETWEVIDAYAYEYYAQNVLPSDPEIAQYAPDLSAIAVSGTYYRTGAKNYAIQYAGSATDDPWYENYNPAYHAFSSDCTNFVSQCLYEGGGIPQIDNPTEPYTSANDWFYYRTGTDSFDSNNDDSWSWSWVKAKTFYYQLQRRLAVEVSSPSQLEIGDIVQLNLFDDTTANDHSMIVTKIDSSGNRYVTYHTTNKRDIPLSDVPGTKYYLHVVY